MILKDSSCEWLWRFWESGEASQDMGDEPVLWLVQYISFTKMFQSYTLLEQATETVSNMVILFSVSCSSKLIELKEEIIGT